MTVMLLRSTFAAATCRGGAAFAAASMRPRAYATSGAAAAADHEAVVEATDQTFDRLVTKSKDVVVVDFYADWCAPCRMLTPLLTKAAAEANVKLVKVNADTSPEATDSFGVTALPTVIAFRHGKPVDKFMGYRDSAFVRTFLNKAKAAGAPPSATA